MGDDPSIRTATFGRDRPAVLVGLVCLSALGTFLAQGLLFPSLPRLLVEELGTTKRTAGLIMTAASLSALLSRPWTGQFIDRRGRRPFLILGPLLTMVSGLGLLAARSVPQLLALRLLQGLAGAMFYGAASASVTDVAPNDRRATYLARYSLFFYVGFATGPALAELLISTRGFDAVWVAVALSTFAGAMLALFIPETGQKQTAAPRMRMRDRFFHPAAVRPGMVYFCVGVGWTAVGTFLALYATNIGMSSSGGLFVALSASVMVTRSIAGSLADRLGRRAVAIPCALACAAGLALLATFRSPGPAFVAVVVFGGGFAGIFPTLLAMVVDHAPPSERGQAMGSFNLFFDIGAPLGGYLTGALIDWSGYGAGFGAMAVVALAGGLLMLATPKAS